MFPSYICFSVAQEFNVFVDTIMVMSLSHGYPEISSLIITHVSNVFISQVCHRVGSSISQMDQNLLHHSFFGWTSQNPSFFGVTRVGKKGDPFFGGALFLQLLMLDRGPFRCLRGDHFWSILVYWLVVLVYMAGWNDFPETVGNNHHPNWQYSITQYFIWKIVPGDL